MIPEAQPRPMNASEAIKKMHSYNTEATERAKKVVSQMSVAQLSNTLKQFGELMSGQYDQETIEIPVDIVISMSLFSSVTVSRLLWEKMKAERSLTNAKS